MLIHVKGFAALRRLRKDWQEDANENYPQDVLVELLVLHDVCKALDFNIFQVTEVLGESGWQAVKSYLNEPACDAVNWEQAAQAVQNNR